MEESARSRDWLAVEAAAVRRNWETVFNAPGLLAMIVDQTQRIVLVSQAAAEAMGGTKESLIGRKCCRIFHHAADPPPTCPLAVAGASGSAGPVKVKLEALRRSFWVSSAPVLGNSGSISSFLYLGQGPAESSRIGAVPGGNPDKGQAGTDRPEEFFWAADLNLKTTYVSPAVEKILGYTPKERLSQQPEETMTPRSLTDLKKLVAEEAGRTGNGSGRPFVVATEHLSKDGATVWLENRITVVRSLAGAAVSLSGTARDVTALKKADQSRTRMEHDRKMDALGLLSGGVAHGFNNLLAIIMGFAELAMVELPEADPARSNMDQIVRATVRGKELLDRMLTFTGRVEIKPVDLNLNQCLLGAKEVLAVPDRIKVELDLASDLDPIRGDQAQLEQVIVSLATNAVEAMPDGGVLTMSTANQTISRRACGLCGQELAGRYVVLGVSDTGIGLSESDLVRVFDPFFTTKSLGQGTGLGLSVTRGLVAGHGGHIFCRAGSGGGTVFEVYLPALDRP